MRSMHLLSTKNVKCHAMQPKSLSLLLLPRMKANETALFSCFSSASLFASSGGQSDAQVGQTFSLSEQAEGEKQQKRE